MTTQKQDLKVIINTSEENQLNVYHRPQKIIACWMNRGHASTV